MTADDETWNCDARAFVSALLERAPPTQIAEIAGRENLVRAGAELANVLEEERERRRRSKKGTLSEGG